jgi:hypothetical protein
LRFDSDLFEQIALMRGVSLHSGDELRNEIGAAFQLHVNVRPPIVDHLPLGDELVEEDDDDDRDNARQPAKM